MAVCPNCGVVLLHFLSWYPPTPSQAPVLRLGSLRRQSWIEFYPPIKLLSLWFGLALSMGSGPHLVWTREWTQPMGRTGSSQLSFHGRLSSLSLSFSHLSLSAETLSIYICWEVE
ncbi:hypothetical protein LWI29_000967 [Acer saccharum]|uniref:Uncharacterized protein n=1 Tax=Acer saccharum TaxID=4024 RepID=A0AA39UFL9_ACESA|nr:hypothetical protein LWI29_000967 [Acer saccharum]